MPPLSCHSDSQKNNKPRATIGFCAPFALLGFTLVEMIVSIAVGLVITAGVIGIYVNSTRSSADTLKMTRLNQELRSVMDIMVRDIRRAGYRGKVENVMFSTPTSTNPFAVNISGNCITYAYDIDNDGSLDSGPSPIPDERFGFRYDSAEKAVERRQSGKTCDEPLWENFTDEDTVEITSFTLIPNLASGVSVGGNISTSTITVNSLTIQLTGNIKNDPTIPPRTLTDTVRMRSDVYTP